MTSNPATAASEPDSPAAALSDLGCEVVAVGYDIDQLPEDIELQRPSVVVVDAGAHLEVGRAAIRRVREVGSLADVPVLLCVEVSRLAGLDPEAGADDFVLSPVVAPELYARIRQLDWRMSSFRAAGRIKIGDLVIDAVAVEASYRGRALKLPRQEFQLLKFLAERPGPRVHARAAAVPRVGLSLRGRHAHRRHPRAPPARQAGPGQRDDRDRAPRRLQAARAGGTPA